MRGLRPCVRCQKKIVRKMSGGLAPSKSTVYVGNLPFSLTNNDIHQVFEKFGKIVKVTILRDKHTRESKGVAFIQYIDKDAAINACKTVNEKQLFERKIKCVIAKDNGRASEFIKKKEYPDKSTCYECGVAGHMSYNCPKNLLGDREPPPKKEKKERRRKREESVTPYTGKKKKNALHDNEDYEDSQDEEGEDPRLSSLSSVINSEAEKYRYEQMRESNESQGNFYTTFTDTSTEVSVQKKKLIKKSSYFSDEEEEFDCG